jgi:outer membrane lipoprotein-sorting protein
MKDPKMRRTSRLPLACGVALVLGIGAYSLDAGAVNAERDAASRTATRSGATQPATAAPAPELPKLTAEQIAERNAQARGGLAAWRSLNSIQFQGQMDAGGTRNTRLPFTLQMRRPHHQRLAIEFQGQTAVQVYDGQNGWKLRPFLNRNDVEPFSDEERQRIARQDDLDGPLIDYAAKGSRVELEGTEMVEGRPNYRLKVTRKDGYARRVWVDGATFLETKIEGNPRRLDGRMHAVENYLRDYRRLGGLMIPYASETKVEGVTQTRKMTIDKIVLNPQLDDRLFGKPMAPAGRASAQAPSSFAVTNVAGSPPASTSPSQ